jgi:hypothetical protein
MRTSLSRAIASLRRALSDRPWEREHSLDVQVSRLGKVFAPTRSSSRDGGYVLEVDPEQIDSRRFERLLEEGRRANAAGRGALTSQRGSRAWREALGNLAYEDFAGREQPAEESARCD